jgi:hypothetical protein
MTLTLLTAERGYEDEEYDSFAVMDAVPLVVSGVSRKGARFLSIFSAFLGIDSEFVGSQERPGA